jgi:hypothetical protein
MATGPKLSVRSLFAERELRRRQERKAEGHLQRRKQVELAEFGTPLDNVQLTTRSLNRVSAGSGAPSSAARPSL